MGSRCKNRLREFHWLPYVTLWALFPAAVFLLYAPDDFEISLNTTTDAFVQNEADLRISPYDELIQKYARRNKMDWRLVASIIHVESSFRRDAVSPKGATGLMQIMPVVAREHGVEIAHRPADNIRAGVRHFSRTFNRIRGNTDSDALKLSLAAYNAGLGHVRDAQNLAMKMGRSPRRWKDVSEMLLRLEDPSVYRDSKYGYCKGTETTEYVKRVMRKYNTYRAIYPKQPLEVAETLPSHLSGASS